MEVDCTDCDNLTRDVFEAMSLRDFPSLRRLQLPVDWLTWSERTHLTDQCYRRLVNACPELQSLENLVAPSGEQRALAAQSGCTMLPHQVLALFPKLTEVHDKPVYMYGRLRQTQPHDAKSKKSAWLQHLSELSVACPEIHTYRCRRARGYIDDETLLQIGQFFPNLSTIELHTPSITCAGLTQFFEQGPASRKLTEIILDNPNEITDEGLKIIAQFCPELEYIKLSHVLDVTNEGVGHLVAGCPRLRQIHLNNADLDKRRPIGRDQWDDTLLRELSWSCPHLENVRLFNTERIKVSGLEPLTHCGRFLTGIMLSNCAGVDDACMQVLTRLRHLKAVVLTECNHVTPQGVLDLVLAAGNLLRLTVHSRSKLFYGPQKELMSSVAEKLESVQLPSPLKKLNVEGVGGDFLEILTAVCPELHTLGLDARIRIDIQAFRNVLRNAEKLACLDLQSVTTYLNEDFLPVLAEHGRCLQKVALGRHMWNFGQKLLANVFTHCTELRFLSMDVHHKKIPDTSNNQSNISPDVDVGNLLSVARASHKGACYLHVTSPNEGGQYVEFHMTPAKYLD